MRNSTDGSPSLLCGRCRVLECANLYAMFKNSAWSNKCSKYCDMLVLHAPSIAMSLREGGSIQDGQLTISVADASLPRVSLGIALELKTKVDKNIYLPSPRWVKLHSIFHFYLSHILNSLYSDSLPQRSCISVCFLFREPLNQTPHEAARSPRFTSLGITHAVK